MRLSHFLKAAAALAVASALSGCFDMDIEVAVVDTDRAAVTSKTTVSKQLIDVAEIKAGESDFCDSANELIETEDTVTCVEVHEGTFAELFPADASGDKQPSVEVIGPKQVKVIFPTADLDDEFGASEEEPDEQAKEMMLQMFAGHTITLRVSGGTITDTNMVKSADGKSAEMVIPLDGLALGEVTVPKETYAVIQLP